MSKSCMSSNKPSPPPSPSTCIPKIVVPPHKTSCAWKPEPAPVKCPPAPLPEKTSSHSVCTKGDWGWSHHDKGGSGGWHGCAPKSSHMSSPDACKAGSKGYQGALHDKHHNHDHNHDHGGGNDWHACPPPPPPPPPPPAPVSTLSQISICQDSNDQLNFSSNQAGDFGRQIFEDNLIVVATRAGDTSGTNAAIVIDTVNPVASDAQLKVANAGLALAISEQASPTSPDAAVAGGTISFIFPRGAATHEIRLIAATEGAVVDVYGTDGALLKSYTVNPMAPNTAGYLLIEHANVGHVDVTLAGVGAVDDLCYDPQPYANVAPFFSRVGDTPIIPDADTVHFLTSDPEFTGPLLVRAFDIGSAVAFSIDPASDGFQFFDLNVVNGDTITVARNGVQPMGPVTDATFDFTLIATDAQGLTDTLHFDWSIG